MYQQTTINCGGRLLDLSTPKIMGILNTTPDSFFDGGKYRTIPEIVDQAGKMLEAGADIIDIGGMSSRPGAQLIPVSEELDRVLPAVEAILTHFPNTIISIDTVRSEVVRQTIATGAHLINDISAGTIDDKLFETVAELNCPYILMHMLGTPADMQQQPDYPDVVVSVMDYLIEKMGRLRALGVKDILIDPGFGFGKTLEHNYTLLKNLSAFNILEVPILVGLSRKSMIHRLLEVTPQTALNGTTALHMVALQNGAKILRVHDVKEAREVVKIFEMVKWVE